MAEFGSLKRAQAIIKIVIFIISFINLLYAFLVITVFGYFAFAVASTPFVPLYFLVMYVCGDVEPAEHPTSTALFDFPFAILNFIAAILAWVLVSVSKDETLIVAEICFGVLFLIVAILLLVDGVFAIIKRE